MIRLLDVHVRVPVYAAAPAPSDKRVLEAVTLDLAEHRIAVVGANGSGKSTMLRLLNGLVLPTSGQVVVDGLDTRHDAAAVRRKVGFVFTEPLHQLLMSTPAEDVELSLRRTIRDRTARRSAALAALARHGLEHLADQSIYDLSGGERQLAALASVLAVEPAVLVADEPTTLLDMRNRDRVRALLAGLDQQVLFATHDLEFAHDAERVIVVDQGSIAFDGSPAEAVDAYRRLMGVP